MVIKGNARGSAGFLAAHLMRRDTNERAEVMELRGMAATDLRGGLRELEAIGLHCTSTKRPLYHASISPDGALTPGQRAAAIDRLEAALGFTGQPRAVVEHEKEGRTHWHVVWSRVDVERRRAIRMDHNYRKHEEVARELERAFGHKRVQGAHAERDGQVRPDRTPTHAEMMQSERNGMSPQGAKQQITAIWRSTDNGKSFVLALEEKGWLLARGDRRDFVVVDSVGEAHSLARRLGGVKARGLRERMADLDMASLPDVKQARAIRLQRVHARGERGGKGAAAALDDRRHVVGLAFDLFDRDYRPSVLGGVSER